MVSIYALINPITNLVFYVGASKNVNSRYKAHIASPSDKCSAKYLEIQNILEEGEKPELLILETCNLEDASFNENFYINLFKSYGFELKQTSKSSYTDSLKTRTGLKEHNSTLRNVTVSKNTHMILSEFLSATDTKIGKWADKAILEKLARETKKEKK